MSQVLVFDFKACRRLSRRSRPTLRGLNTHNISSMLSRPFKQRPQPGCLRYLVLLQSCCHRPLQRSCVGFASPLRLP